MAPTHPPAVEAEITRHFGEQGVAVVKNGEQARGQQPEGHRALVEQIDRPEDGTNHPLTMQKIGATSRNSTMLRKNCRRSASVGNGLCSK